MYRRNTQAHALWALALFIATALAQGPMPSSSFSLSNRSDATGCDGFSQMRQQLVSQIDHFLRHLLGSNPEISSLTRPPGASQGDLS
jgi:hypothetical protein